MNVTFVPATATSNLMFVLRVMRMARVDNTGIVIPGSTGTLSDWPGNLSHPFLCQ